jgi:carboxyl-terminal processing protease
MPLRNLIVIFTAAAVSYVCYQKLPQNRYASAIAEGMSVIEANYVEDIDSQLLYEGAMDGMLDKLDRHSSYISPRDYAQFRESITQQFGGVGIIVEIDPETERLTVFSPLPKTPAYKVGLQAGDTIMEIDGNSTEGMSIQDSVDLMRGPSGEPVKLVIQRPGEEGTRKLAIKREIIPVDSVLGDTHNKNGEWNFALFEDKRIAYLRIVSFGDETVVEVRRALASYDYEAIILDFRDNPGGLLDAAVDLTDLFVDEGRIVSTRGRGGKLIDSYEASPRRTVVPAATPVVVLINNDTASAAEIVAAALQDHDRAVVIGERSWGKGTVQNIVKLDGGKSALKLTTARYWRPSGKNIHRVDEADESAEWGVKPNKGFEVVLSDEDRKAVFKNRRNRDKILPQPLKEPPALADPQLEKAIQTIKQQLQEIKTDRA